MLSAEKKREIRHVEQGISHFLDLIVSMIKTSTINDEIFLQIYPIFVKLSALMQDNIRAHVYNTPSDPYAMRLQIMHLHEKVHFLWYCEFTNILQR